jgi:hypothetical protein
MNPCPISILYKRHRFPAEIISHCVWLYFRCCLSYRDIEELMAARGVILSYEAMRYWYRKFGQAYANQLRRRRPRPGDKWHLDEVFLTINGQRQMSSSYSHRILVYFQNVSARRPCSSHRIPAEPRGYNQANAPI